MGGVAAYAQLYVCPYTATGMPCSPQSNIYSNIGLTGSPLPQPFASDQYGNFLLYVAQGTYLVQVKINNTVTYSYVYSAVPSSSSGGGSGGSTIGISVGNQLKCDPTGATDCSTAIQNACTAQPGATILFDLPLGQTAATYLLSSSSSQTFSASCSYLFTNGAQVKSGNQAAASIGTIQRVGLHGGTIPTLSLSSCSSSQNSGTQLVTFTSCPNTFQQYQSVVLTGLTHSTNCYYGCEVSSTSATGFIVLNPAIVSTVSSGAETGSAIALTGDFDIQLSSGTTSVNGGIMTVNVTNPMPAVPNLIQMNTTHAQAGTYTVIPSSVSGSSFQLVCPGCPNVSSGAETGDAWYQSGGLTFIHFSAPLPGIGTPGKYQSGQFGPNPPTLICTGTSNYNGPFWIATIADSQDIAIYDPRGSAAQETSGSCYIPYTATFYGSVTAPKSQQIVAHGSGVIAQGNSSVYVAWYGAQGNQTNLQPDDSLAFQEALFWGQSKKIEAPHLMYTQGIYSGGPPPNQADYFIGHGLQQYGPAQELDGESGGLWDAGTVLQCTSLTDPCVTTPPGTGQAGLNNIMLQGEAYGPVCQGSALIPVAPFASTAANDGWFVGGASPHAHQLTSMCFNRDGVHLVSAGMGFNFNAYGSSATDYWTIDNLFTWDNLGYGFSCWGSDCNAGTMNGTNDAHGSAYGGYFDAAQIASTFVSANGESNSRSFGAGPTSAITSLTVSGSGYNAVCSFTVSGGPPASFVQGAWVTVIGATGTTNANITAQLLAGAASYICPGGSGSASTGTIGTASSNSTYTAIEQYPTGYLNNYWQIVGLIGGSYTALNPYSESNNGCVTGTGLIIGGDLNEFLYQGNCTGAANTSFAPNRFSGGAITAGTGGLQVSADYMLLRGVDATSGSGTANLELNAPWSQSGTAFNGTMRMIYSTFVDQNFYDWQQGVFQGDIWKLIDTANNGVTDTQTIMEVIPSNSTNETWLQGPSATGTLLFQPNSTGNVNFFSPSVPSTVIATTGTTTNGLTLSGILSACALKTNGGGVVGAATCAGSGAGVTTGPTSSTSADLASFTGTAGQLQDSGLATANMPRYCGTAAFSSSATSGPLSCAWVTAGSHCTATWVGTTVAGGALGFTAGSATVTLTAANSNSQSAAVFCSAN